MSKVTRLLSLFFLLGSLLFPLLLPALEDVPWLGNDKEFELRGQFLYQNSDEVALKNLSVSEEMNTYLTSLSLGISPMHPWAAELQVDLGEHVRQSSYSYLGSKLRLRKQFYSDLVGDPFTLSSGLTLIIPKNKTMVNIRELPYADVNTEAYVSCGKEITKGGSYSHRFYSLGALGIKSKGGYWLRAKASAERNYLDTYRLEAYIEGAFSLGKGQQPAYFEGPRKLIKASFHQLDIGMRFTYRVDFVGEWFVGFSKRLKGKNVPSRPVEGMLGFFVPFFP